MCDVSGTAVLRAPEMQELLRLIESPDIHGVVAKEFSRLMRPDNFKDYALLQAFVDSDTVLYLPDGPLDLASAMGGLMGMIRAGMARIERRRNSDAHERREGSDAAGRSEYRRHFYSAVWCGLLGGTRVVLHFRGGEGPRSFRIGVDNFTALRRDRTQAQRPENKSYFHTTKSHLYGRRQYDERGTRPQLVTYPERTDAKVIDEKWHVPRKK